MPARSPLPGLIAIKRKHTRALYWSARSLARDIEGFPDKLVRIPADATPAQIADICEAMGAKLQAWLYGQRGASYRTQTIADLCDAFERHPQSPMQGVKHNTHGSYADSLKIIRATLGPRVVREVKPVEIMEWFGEIAAPRQEGQPPRLKRAHDAVSILRATLKFGFVLGDEHCRRLRDQLAEMQFKRAGKRDSAMTFQHVLAFIKTAQEWPEDRSMMALGVATQWETMLRQKDVIGERIGGEWRGNYTWENIPGWKWTTKTSKTKAPITFDLSKLELLWPLLQAVPQEQRTGAIIKGWNGLPIVERTYRKWYRQIARKAGIPDDVWNMDSRAGAVTEALESGADIADVARAATHSRQVMTERYDRGVTKAVIEIAEARRTRRRK